MKSFRKKPPKLFKLLLRLISKTEEQFSVVGDFEEIYNDIVKEKGLLAALRWYSWQIIKSLPLGIIHRFIWSFTMFKNYLKIAIRNIKRQKIYSMINILGLAIGMTMAMLILLWVWDEISYDRFHVNVERIYRVSQVHNNEGRITKQANTPAVLAETLMLECPEVELATSIRGDRDGTIIKKNDVQFHETGIGITDHNFFNIFSFPFIEGDSKTALVSPWKVVISQKAAKKYFKDSNPFGQTLTFYDMDFIITGIFQDMPPNSHFHFDLLCSKKSFEQYSNPQWEWNPFKTYLRMHASGSVEALQTKLNEIASTRMFGDGYAEWFAKGNSKTLPLQKLTDIHLNSNLRYEFEANGNSLYVRFFTIIAIFILIIAVINYMNLSTARSAGRAREVGIRKTVGSTRAPIIRQFLFESVLTSLFSLILTLVFAQLMLPAFRQLVGKSWLVIPYQELPFLIPSFIILTIIIGILSGIYPAFFLSAFKPIAVLSGSTSKGLKSSRYRNGLVVFQFTLSIFLLIAALVVQKQMNFVLNRDLGFNRDQVVVLQTLGEVNKKMSSLRETLLQNPSINAVSASSTIPGKSIDFMGFHMVGSNDSWPGTNLIAADPDFLDVMKVEMVEGRFFSKDFQSDGQAVIINETKAGEIELDDVFNKRFNIGGMGDESFHVIGIIKDFHYQSLHEPVKAMGFVLLSGIYGGIEDYVSIRIHSENIRETIVDIRKVWEKIIPGSPFSFSFLDTIYNDQYQNEERTGRVFSIFTLFAIFVATIGLLGLASFAAEQRTREIGIRKVLGASANRIIRMLSGESVRLVILANFIAWPAAHFIMAQWLENFTYRTEIGLIPFFLSAIIMFAISGLTVSYHAAKAAFANPVEALKNE